ncbi:hypothetical protein [Bacillus mycoides]
MTTNKSNDSEKELTPLDIDIIDMGDARKGVQVTIPAYTNMEAGDTIQLYWGSRTLDYKIDKAETNGENLIYLHKLYRLIPGRRFRFHIE